MGSKFLKVTGILMIIFGAISIVVSIIALMGLGVLEALGAPMGLLWASGIIAFVGSIAQLVAGIIGVVNCDKPEKANSCIVWGMAVAAMSIIANVITLIGYPQNFSFVSVISGLLIPVLYLIGAFKNKQSN